MSGGEFELINYRNCWQRGYVDFLDRHGTTSSVALEWTDAAGIDPFVELSGGRSHFRVEELLRLVDLLSDLSVSDGSDGSDEV